jgi:hypothetical protein
MTTQNTTPFRRMMLKKEKNEIIYLCWPKSDMVSMDISPKLNGCIQPCARPSGTIWSLEWEEFDKGNHS